jgi:hypothetical protein
MAQVTNSRLEGGGGSPPRNTQTEAQAAAARKALLEQRVAHWQAELRVAAQYILDGITRAEIVDTNSRSDRDALAAVDSGNRQVQDLKRDLDAILNRIRPLARSLSSPLGVFRGSGSRFGPSPS